MSTNTPVDWVGRNIASRDASARPSQGAQRLGVELEDERLYLKIAFGTFT